MVSPKKHLGQHFLMDKNIARKIVASLTISGYRTVLEIGPGQGALTNHLLANPGIELFVCEIDTESVDYLKHHFPILKGRLIYSDFLALDLGILFKQSIAIIGNFPYNISSQILFRIYEHRNKVIEVVGMFQKEVAERIAAKPRTKQYGILSVLMQAFYKVEYPFTVNETVFFPRPKVKSAVIRLTRSTIQHLDCDEELFKTVVKTAFNQRRKTLRNSLRAFLKSDADTSDSVWMKRAEELSVEEFAELVNLLSF